MTIIKADAKGLEVVCAAYLSRDKVMMQELLDGVDIHGANQVLFNLPRLIAKILKFRIIYGGNEYSFANDPDFAEVSTNKKYWKEVIEKYFNKYKGLAEWHTKLIQEVTTTGKYTTPTGRTFKFEPKKDFRGELQWPITQIKNFPVQGTGADAVSICRVSFAKRFKDAKIDGVIINTVHDDIVSDVAEYEIERVNNIYHSVFRDFSTNFERLFKVKWDVPLLCEVSIGDNMKDLTEIKM